MAFFPIRVIPDNTRINFLGKKYIAFVLSFAIIISTFGILMTKGLNFGIDFTGGILIEAKFDQEPDLTQLRSLLKLDELGDISLQTFGQKDIVLIRIGNQSGSEKERLHAVNLVKDVLSRNIPYSIDYRKVDYVGPKVGSELIISGLISLLLSIVAILLYVWFRFEWQYGAGAIIALVHDTIVTVGFFSLTQIEFNLSSIAAILTIIGYSINDSVVIFDRIRENVRKFKKMPIEELLNLSINDNLARTTLTSFTTLVALFALVLVGGEVVRGFSLACLVGITVGTYSSIYVASPVLVYMKLRPEPNAAS